MWEWLRGRPWHRLLPLPALLVQALVMLGSHRVWTETVMVTSRTGSTRPVIVAHTYLMGAAVTGGGYWVTYLLGDTPLLGGRGVRPPTEAEVGCVLGMLRILLAVALYALTTRIVWVYAFGL